MKPLFVSSLLVVGALGCGSSAVNVLGEGDAGGAPAGDGGTSTTPAPPSATDPGGGLTAAACADGAVTDIAGTWDIITTRLSSTDAHTVTIDATRFTYRVGDNELSFAVNGGVMTLDWADGARKTPIAATRTAEPLDLGIVPLGVGGTWKFSSTTSTESCTAQVGASGFNASCNGQISDMKIGGTRGTLMGQRTSTLPSLFGELGGTWKLIAQNGGSADVTVSGNEFRATTKSLGSLRTGSIVVKVCNGSLTGITSGGFEIAGTRQ